MDGPGLEVSASSPTTATDFVSGGGPLEITSSEQTPLSLSRGGDIARSSDDDDNDDDDSAFFFSGGGSSWISGESDGMMSPPAVRDPSEALPSNEGMTCAPIRQGSERTRTDPAEGGGDVDSSEGRGRFLGTTNALSDAERVKGACRATEEACRTTCEETWDGTTG